MNPLLPYRVPFVELRYVERSGARVLQSSALYWADTMSPGTADECHVWLWSDWADVPDA